MQIRKAERRKARLRVGFSSPSGGGKTYSAILMAKGIVNGDMSKVCLIDTENGRGDLYSDLGEYNIIPLEAPFTPERYIEAIQMAEEAKMEVIIVDSITHEWEGKGGCLEMNENLANAKYRGNTWSAWNETTPRHRKFIEALISSPAHIITTVRNKIDTIMTDDKKVKKVGIKELTREGFEYELTLNFNIDRDTHMVTASKDNTKIFESRDPFVVTEETGKELLEWAEKGVDHKSKLIDEIVAILPQIGKKATEETMTFLHNQGNAKLEVLLQSYQNEVKKSKESKDKKVKNADEKKNVRS